MLSKDPKVLKKDIILHATLRNHAMVFHTTWGLFSPEHIDEGSTMLLEEIDIGPGDSILDLGCGYGPLGLALAKDATGGIVHCIDKDFVAVEYAKKNAELNRLDNTKIYLSNAFDQIDPEMRFDCIVSNLPAKVSGEMLYIIMSDAKKYLKDGGKFYVVVIAGLKEYIKRNFMEIFGNFEKCKQGKTYMVAMASRN